MGDQDRGMVTRALRAIRNGDPKAAEELLPLVYDALRSLARARMARVPPGNTLQATALVHEAYLRLVGGEDLGWNSRGHFFGAAANAMRQILVDQARRKAARKHGGGLERVDADEVEIRVEGPGEDILALDEALTRLEAEDPRKARIVKLRHFAGLTREETAAALGLSIRTIDYEWRYIVARLHRDLAGESSEAW